MSKFEPGWLLPDTEQNHINSDIGDALILLGDRQDMGTFRFSDVDRNLIVASTDMPSLSKGSFDKQTINRKKHAHYSKTEYASDVYGENGVYVDRLVTNEEVWIDSIDNDWYETRLKPIIEILAGGEELLHGEVMNNIVD